MKQLVTRWGKEIDPGHVREEYPRPMMVRGNWESLNGWWEYAFTAAQPEQDPAAGPQKWDGKILVPFSPESALSGVGRQLQPSEYLWYKRSFQSSPAELCGHRLLLHFDAVDQECVVCVNGREVISHVGGYLPFCADITQAVADAGAEGQRNNTILVRVRDYSDTSCHARGKQKLERGGMFYTAVSGIWKNVWLEYVQDLYVTGLSATSDIDRKLIRMRIDTNSEDLDQPSGSVKAVLRVYRPKIYTEDPELKLPVQDPLLEQEIQTDTDLEIPIPEIRLWNCGEPWLYQYSVSLINKSENVQEDGDSVRSYFAMRQFSLEPREEENLPGRGRVFPRICLNHEVLFQKGVLDQGYWPESILTPPSDGAILFDLTEMKKTGFNMVRKHIKIEEERWYFHCDRLGLIVWQDMVNGGGPLHSWYVTYLATALSVLRIRQNDRNYRLFAREDKEGRDEFVREMLETIRLLKNHPSISTWVIFNEGWGQFHTNELTELARQADPTRLIDQASGWFDQGGGDLCSVHNYFMKLSVRPERVRANVLSEFGGKAFLIPEHSCMEKLYGYGTMRDLQQLNAAYKELDEEMSVLIPQGLCASVYTQWTDIEDEVNGIFTYDREIRKIREQADTDEARQKNKK